MKIYVVMGTTGEYSDHIEWPIAAYLDKENAEAHVLRATMWFKSLYVQLESPPEPYITRQIPESVLWPFDMNRSESATSFVNYDEEYSYFIYETELVDEPPEEQLYVPQRLERE